MHIGKARFERRERRPLADDDFRARQIETEESGKVLFMRDTADIKKDRPLERRPLVTQFRIENRWIDAAAPRREIVEAMTGELVAHGFRRHHYPHRRRVEPAQQRVGETLRRDVAHREIFGKARVISGGEAQAMLQAPAPRRDPDRPFGDDVDRIGLGLLDHPRDGARPG